MPRLDSLPDDATIQQFKGALDFYNWRGLAVVRAWPRPPKIDPASPCRATAAEFGRFTQAAATTDTILIAQWSAATANTGWSWRDAALSAAYAHANLG